MSSKKRTAVEWLAAVVSEMRYVSTDVLNQALEMEKQQIIQSYSDGLGNGIAVGREESSFESVCDEEKYYKETYED